MSKRPRGGRVSLTAREADLLLTVITTCDDIAADSTAFTKLSISRDEAYAAWEVIIDKVRQVTPSTPDTLGETP